MLRDKPNPIDRSNIEILTEREIKLLNLLRDVHFGKVEISVEDNQPVRAITIRENIAF